MPEPLSWPASTFELKLSDREKIGEAIRTEVFRRLVHPFDINNGECEDFAEAVVESVGFGESTWGDNQPQFFTDKHDPSIHCYIEHDGLYFDAEEPNGVTTPDRLPIYLRQIWR